MKFNDYQIDTPILLICKRYQSGKDIAKEIYRWVIGDMKTHQKNMKQVFEYINKLKKCIIELEQYDDQYGDENDINYGELYKFCRNRDLFKYSIYHQGLDHLTIMIPCLKLPGSNCTINKSFAIHEYYHRYVYTESFAYNNILERKVHLVELDLVLTFEISYRKAYQDHLEHYYLNTCAFCFLDKTHGVEKEDH